MAGLYQLYWLCVLSRVFCQMFKCFAGSQNQHTSYITWGEHLGTIKTHFIGRLLCCDVSTVKATIRTDLWSSHLYFMQMNSSTLEILKIYRIHLLTVGRVKYIMVGIKVFSEIQFAIKIKQYGWECVSVNSSGVILSLIDFFLYFSVWIHWMLWK